MTRKVFAVLCLLLAVLSQGALPDITGTWKGNIAANNTNVPVHLDVSKDASGKLKAVFIDDDGSHVVEIRQGADRSVAFDFHVPDFTDPLIYHGMLSAGNAEITGQFSFPKSVGGPDIPLTLRR